MDILLSEQFKAELKIILEFYFEKSPEVADNFYNDLFAKIDNISFMPNRFRKNKIFYKNNIRDLIFNGYVIPFQINNNTIKILSIFKYNLPNL